LVPEDLVTDMVDPPTTFVLLDVQLHVSSPSFQLPRFFSITVPASRSSPSFQLRTVLLQSFLKSPRAFYF
jgi:hypothetical protein